MMIRTVKALVGVAALVCASSAMADNVWFQGAAIGRILPMADGRIALTMDDSNPSCDQYWIQVNQNGVTLSGLKNIHAAALTALAVKSKVNIAYEKTGGVCYVNRISVIKPS